MQSSFTNRICRFEQMEPRQMLAADLSLGAIAGQVAMSDDDSGVESSGVESVVLRLLGETGHVLDETQTNAEGNYRFADLAPGIYAVLEVQPAGIFDGRALVGSGGGVAFDSNLLGEIVVHSGSDLVGYNFREFAADKLTGSGGLADQPLVAHALLTPVGEGENPAGAVLQILYGSAPVSLPQNSQLIEPPATFSAIANYQPALPANLLSPPPFFGNGGDGTVTLVTGDWNGNGQETLGTFHGGLWRLDLDGDGQFTDADSEVRFGGEGDEPVVGDWNGDGIDDLGVLRNGQRILDREGNRELDAEDYDRALELSEGENELRLEERAAKEKVPSIALKPKA